MKTLLTQIMLIPSGLILALSLTSCNKDNRTGVDSDTSVSNSSDPRKVSVSKHQEFKIVEFDGFVDISAPIVQEVANEGMVVTESGIEMPVFRTSESADSKKLNRKGEQDVAPQSATRSESDLESSDKP